MSAVATEKEQRAVRRKGTEDVLTHRQIKKFPKAVRDVLLALVNTYGVTYRVQADGQHIFLYDGRQGTRPFKVAASRPAETGIPYLLRWIETNVPDFESDIRTAKSAVAGVRSLFKCVHGCGAEFDSPEAINEHYRLFHAEPEPEPEPESEKEPHPEPMSEGDAWKPLVYSTGRTSDTFEVLGDRLRCIFPGCDFTREGSFVGAHLHEAHHSDQAGEMLRRGVETRRANDAARHEQARQSLSFLAHPHGFVVMTREEVQELRSNRKAQVEVEGLRKQIEALTTERDEARAKLALIQEAMRL